MRFTIVVNTRLENSEAIAENIRTLLEKEHRVETDTLTREKVQEEDAAGKDTPDVVVTVGGDGTILSALQRYDTKILGINIGEVGFLTEVAPQDLEKALEKVVSGDYHLDERIRVKSTMNGERMPDALNEIVIHTTQIAKMQEFQAKVNDETIMNVRSDGMIVATPTGSTCYSMSAGGPIVDPKVSAFVIQPIAPYKLSARPFVVPSRCSVTLELRRERECSLVFDGQHQVTMNKGDVLVATESETPARFIRFEGGFYSHLQRKLSQSFL